ncbi:TEC1 family protein [Pleurotus pulmonarius]|nr:hypothetical protein EYR38_002408 [Pleurotus pulmonarius]
MKIPPTRLLKRPEQKSLTPRRKHWKTASDGIEVWPEHVEKVFVQGLREYKDSPFAAHSFSRCKFRNQLLVEYLAKAGITRSKKQVASHIQVLRSMWKGTPEFHLVSNVQELAALDPLTPRTLQEYEILGDSSRRQHNPSDTSLLHESPRFPLPPLLPVLTSPPILPFPDSSPVLIPTQPELQFAPSKNYADMTTPLAHRQPSWFAPHAIANRVIAFCLVTGGAPPLVVSFESMVLPASSLGYSWEIETELHMTPLGVCSGKHEALAGSVVLAAPFVSGTCTTRLFIDQQCIHKEDQQLYPSPTDPLVAFLPADSPLAKCRSYFNEPFSTTSTLTQEWMIDGVTLLYAVHVLGWLDGNAPPSARLVECRPHKDNAQKSGTAVVARESSQRSSTAYRPTIPSSTLYQHMALLLAPSPSSNATSLEISSNHDKAPAGREYSYHHSSVSHSFHQQPPTLSRYSGSSLYDPFLQFPLDHFTVPDFHL